ncbi:hypothetical protein DPX16_1969 [Anabarilius grahami]|uniref:Uncharacterized protein n=1 Tax=Anabarilius grahami TaxID=495550 RepID=A0A3N0YII7_ANAGA|nr:hypothetical protein DPX16_1969 [Anabarilius grahami]
MDRLPVVKVSTHRRCKFEPAIHRPAEKEEEVRVLVRFPLDVTRSEDPRADQSSCGRQLTERRRHTLRAAVRSCSKYVCAMFCKLRETTSSDIPPLSCCLRAVCVSLALSDCLR